MTLPRRVLINPEYTPYYHCVSRCVRRAFLCGQDALTGYDFQHRRDWIEKRLLKLADIFAIDVCAFAIMSNHYHLVLHINSAKLRAWSDDEIILRWQRLHRLPEWFLAANVDNECAKKTLGVWRDRLGNISWFMKCINEPLARQANKEDRCTGRFWEGRFKSQALLDDESVLKCMAYVDLNPVRAQIAGTIEDSEHTSIQRRIRGTDSSLAPMAGDVTEGFALSVARTEYVALVTWTGSQFRSDKRGRLLGRSPPFFEIPAVSIGNWYDDLRELTRRYYRAIGSAASLAAYRDFLGQRRLKGLVTER